VKRVALIAPLVLLLAGCAAPAAPPKSHFELEQAFITHAQTWWESTGREWSPEVRASALELGLSTCKGLQIHTLQQMTTRVDDDTRQVMRLAARYECPDEES
jgi:hypothetical protein